MGNGTPPTAVNKFAKSTPTDDVGYKGGSGFSTYYDQSGRYKMDIPEVAPTTTIEPPPPPEYTYTEPQGFWSNPSNLAKFYFSLQAIPVHETPNWVDRQAINNAYDYMQMFNQGLDWTEWKGLPDGDPVKEYLDGIPAPPQEVYQMYPNRVDFLPYSDVAPVPEGEMAFGGLTQEQLDALPLSKKALMYVLSSPGRSGATIGGIAALGGGPTGMLFGGMLGAGIGNLGTKFPQIMDWLNFLNYPADWTERVLGTLGLGYGNIKHKIQQDQGQKGWFMAGADAAAEILNNLDSAWEASRLYYETMPLDLDVGAVSTDPVTWETRQLDPSEIGFDRFYKAFQEIEAGANPDNVYQSVRQDLGLEADLRDLLGFIVLDPLNFIAAIGGLGLKALGAINGIDALQAAARTHWRNPIKGLGAYGQAVRQGTAYTEKVLAAIPDGEKTALLVSKTQPWELGGITGRLTRAVSGVDVNGKWNITKQLAKPGLLNRLGGALVMGGGGGLMGYAVGPVGAGILGLGGLRLGWKNGIKALFSLDSASKIDEIIGSSIRLASEVAERAGGDEATMVKYLSQLANNPVALGRSLGMATLDSPEAAVIPMVFRGIADKLAKDLDVFTINNPNRQFLKGMAEALNITDTEVLFELSKKSTDVDALLQQVKNTIDGSTDLGKSVIDAIDNGDLDSTTAQEMVKLFWDKKMPYNTETFKASAIANMIDIGAKWGVDWFGIKPSPGIMRAAQVIKHAQSVLVLGLNPLYFINNAFDNIMVSVAEGVFGFSSGKSIDDFWNRWGYKHIRFGEAHTPADLGRVTDLHQMLLKPIKDAQIKKGGLQKTDDIVKAASNKIGFFSKASGNLEAYSRARAWTNGVKQFWRRVWKQGIGYEKLPAHLEAQLSAIDPDLPKFIYDAINSGVSKQEIENALWADATRRSVDSFIPELTDIYEGRLTPEEIGDMLEPVQIRLEELLRTAENNDQVVQAFDKLGEEIQQNLLDQMVMDLVNEADEASQRVIGEGVQAAYEIYNRIEMEEAARWLTNFDEWGDVFLQVENLDPASRHVIIMKQFEMEDKKWRIFHKHKVAAYAGIAEALGLDSEISNDILALLAKNEDNWVEFHTQKRAAYRAHFLAPYENKKAWKKAWNELQKEQKVKYTDSIKLEKSTQVEMDKIFVDLFSEKYGKEAGQAAKKWRASIRKVRAEMAKSMDDFRTSIEDVKKPAERRAKWNTYLRDEYRPAIVQKLNEAVIGAKEMYKKMAGVPEEATEATAKSVAKGELEEATKVAGEELKVTPEDIAAIEEKQTALGYLPGRTKRAQVRAIASRWGMDTATEGDGHLLATLRKKEYDGVPGITLEQAAEDPAVVHAIFEKRYKIKMEQYTKEFDSLQAELVEIQKEFNQAPTVGAKADIFTNKGKTLSDKVAKLQKQMDALVNPATAMSAEETVMVEAVKARKEMNARFNRWKFDLENAGVEPVVAWRENFRQGAINVMGIEPERVDAFMTLMDARARVWGTNHARNPHEYYKRYLGFTKGYVPGTAPVAGQAAEGIRKGATLFTDEGRAIISALEQPDFTTMVHEVGHVFRRDLDTTELQHVTNWLRDEYGKNIEIDVETGRFVDDGTRLVGADGKRYTKPQFAEEAFARAFERYITDGVAPTSTLQKLFESMKRWMLEIYKTVTGTPLDVRLNAEITGVFNRLLDDESARYIGGTGDFKGIGRIKEALFQIVAPVESENFKQWFGQSKVIDENGMPLVVYHGTKASVDFTEFRPTYWRKNVAGYFALDPSYADLFADSTKDPSRVIPVFLRIEDPYDVSSFTAREHIPLSVYFEQIPEDDLIQAIDQISDEGQREAIYKWLRQDWTGTTRNPWQWSNNSGVREVLQNLGYDGIIHNEHWDKFNWDTGEDLTKVSKAYLIFDSNQAKSVFNDGGFSRQTDHILHQIENEMQVVDDVTGETTFKPLDPEITAQRATSFNDMLRQIAGSGDRVDRDAARAIGSIVEAQYRTAFMRGDFNGSLDDFVTNVLYGYDLDPDVNYYDHLIRSAATNLNDDAIMEMLRDKGTLDDHKNFKEITKYLNLTRKKVNADELFIANVNTPENLAEAEEIQRNLLKHGIMADLRKDKVKVELAIPQDRFPMLEGTRAKSWVNNRVLASDYAKDVNEVSGYNWKTRTVRKNLAVHDNPKTLISLDFNSNCTFRENGTPCSYCYVEPQRVKKALGMSTGTQAPNLVYDAAPWDDTLITQMPDDVVDLVNTQGGLRIFSIGDLKERDLPGLFNIIDLAREKGLDLKFITKQTTLANIDPAGISDAGRELLKMRTGVDLKPGTLLDTVELFAPLQTKDHNIRFNISTDFEFPEVIVRTAIDNALNKKYATNETAMTIDEIYKGARVLESYMAEGGERIWSYGVPLDEAVAIKTKYPDQVRIRYVSMNDLDWAFALLDNRIDVLTAFHSSDYKPDFMLKLWEMQDPHIREWLGPEGQALLSNTFNVRTPGEWFKGDVAQSLVDEVNGLKKLAGEEGNVTVNQLNTYMHLKECCLTGRCGTCLVGCGFGVDSDSAITRIKRITNNRDRTASKLLDDGTTIIYSLSEMTNIVDAVEAILPIFRQYIPDDDLKILQRWMNIEDGNWTESNLRDLGRTWVNWLATQSAPTNDLIPVFDTFKRYLSQIYLKYGGPIYNRRPYKKTGDAERVYGVLNRLVGVTDDAWQESGDGSFRLLGKAPMTDEDIYEKLLYQNADGTIDDMIRNGESPDPANMPLGAVDGMNPAPPFGRMKDEYFDNMQPLLKNLQELMVDPEKSHYKINLKKANLTKDIADQLNGHLDGVYGSLSDNKIGADRWGAYLSDRALLNYGARTGIHNIAEVGFPYSFYYLTAGLMWMLRSIDRPSWLANNWRIRQLQENVQEQPGFPSRLAGKIKLPAPGFLPDFMGDTMYLQIRHKAFPFEQLMRPFQQLSEQQSHEQRQTMYVIEEWADDGSISIDDAKQAMDTMSGPIWDKAYAQAQLDFDREISNPFDFMSTMVSPSMPIQWAYNFYKGTPEKINLLPATRMIQAATAWMKPGGVNIEEGIRQGIGLPAGNQYDQFKLIRELANMVGDGTITLEEGTRTMVEQSGPVWELAKDRLGKTNAVRYVGSALWLDFFPEGEKHMRELQLEFHNAYESGNPEAVQEFWDEHPEYAAQIMRNNWDDPEAMMHTFLRSNIWKAYNELSSVDKWNVQDVLGDDFKTLFLDKETRSYNSIDIQTLTNWARVMNAYVPEGQTPETQPMEPVPTQDSEIIQAYLDDRNQLFPGISLIEKGFFGLPEDQRDAYLNKHPELNEYWAWKDEAYFAHPALAQYLMSEENELYDVPDEIRQMVYEFRIERRKSFPNALQLQEEFFAIPDGPDQKRERYIFIGNNPELSKYWDWKDWVEEQFPEIVPYISSRDFQDKSLSVENAKPVPEPIDIRDFPDGLIRQLVGHFYNNEPLTSGAREKLYRIWTQAGQPGLDLDSWVEGELRYTFY